MALTTRITKSEFDRALRKPPQVLEAYDYYLRGNALLRSTLGDPTPFVVVEARAQYEQSLAEDPHYASAMQALANTYIVAWADPNFPEYHKRASIDHAQSLAQQAVDLDPTLAEAHATLGWILRFRRDSEAFAVFERAFTVNPNFVDSRFAIMLAHGGRPAEAIDYMRRIMRLDPLHPHTYIYLLGKGHFFLGQYDQAIEFIRTASVRMPAHRRSRILLASVAAHLGRDEEACAAAAEVLRMHPGFTITEFVSHMMLGKA